MTAPRRIVIVGTSIAGITAAEELRADGFDGTITLIGDETEQPYSKPPLSKAFLAGSETDDDIRLPDLDHLDIDLIAGVAAHGLDRDRRRVLLDGDEVPYDGLVIATGARAATLRDWGGNPDGLDETVLRTADDARALRALLVDGHRLTVVGGGVLGMEIASTAASAGMDVTVIGTTAPMLSALGPYVSQLILDRALDAGVIYSVASKGAVLEAAGGRTRVRAGGETIESDAVVTAVGCVPNVAWLRDSGLSVSPGLIVDERCRVASDIVAAGDVVSLQGRARTPHWSSALGQGRSAAAALLRGDEAEPYVARPYFWTHQFDLSLKVAGEGIPDHEPELLDGDLADLTALWRWSTDGSPVAAVALNRHIPISRLHAHAGQA
ncbi:NAD(P)/FAD-dependent oxidoreductase [Microbacterium sp. CPCC 204701]|uniref:NAD(P)/FAD-dependent oxidoreductase n=1 Tax=Microbacterium sp. CPCC 204701 TaxID=2493084 RepID=UPI000FDA7B09|nr:FAD-dependent oxidoreductase [Microbacterium sp. CPCC 204701]